MQSSPVKAEEFSVGFRITENEQKEKILQIPDHFLGKDFCIFTTLLETPGKIIPGTNVGFAGDRFGPRIIRFCRDGNKIRLDNAIAPELLTDDPSSGLSILYSEKNTWSAVQWFDIIEDKGSYISINADEWFFDNNFFALGGIAFNLRLGNRVDEESHIDQIICRNDQIIVRSTNLYEGGMMSRSGERKMSTWKVGACMSMIHNGGMTPSVYDTRVGYMKTPGAAEKENMLEKVSMITRWNIDNGDIKFYYSKDYPEDLIKVSKKSFRNWQEIFDALDIDCEISLSEAPDDEYYSIDNCRVNWISVKDVNVENAYGRSFFDPRNGQILSSCISIFNGVRNLVRMWYINQNGSTKKDIPQEDMDAMMEMMITHEIGHVLGLEHNFSGSSAYTVEQLRDAEHLFRYSHGSSIMDYMRLNYVAQPQDSISFSLRVPRVATYDKAAIAWGYTPMLLQKPGERLEIQSKSAERMSLNASTRYIGQSRVNIQALMEDESDNPVMAAILGMTYMEMASTSDEGMPREIVLDAVKDQYNCNINNVIAYFGGKKRVYDMQGLQYIPVTASEQKFALDYIENYVINPPKWLAPEISADVQEIIVFRLLDRLKYVEQTAASGLSGYSPEDYLKDIRKLFVGDVTSAPRDEYRQKLIMHFTDNMMLAYRDKGNSAWLRCLIRADLNHIRSEVEKDNHPFWMQWKKYIDTELI